MKEVRREWGGGGGSGAGLGPISGPNRHSGAQIQEDRHSLVTHKSDLTILPPSAAPSGVPLPKDQTLCPLCKNVRVNPAVSSAGVAFCYRCLIAHVREVGVCPVTLQACREEQVRRVYLT